MMESIVTNPALKGAISALSIPLSATSGVPLGSEFAKKKALRVFTEKVAVSFKDPAGGCTTVHCRPFITIKELKRKLAEVTQPQGFELMLDMDPKDESTWRSALLAQRLFFQGQVLKDTKCLRDYNICDGDVVYRLAEEETKSSHDHDVPSPVEPKVQVVLGHTPISKELSAVLDGVREGLTKGLAPVLAPSGLGGTYFLRNKAQRIVGVFKPEDEEAYAPNNPRGLAGKMGSRGVRNGLLSGEANVREVAAYLLDHESFAKVPATLRVEVSHPDFGEHPKIGSLQEFKPHDDEAGDVSASLFTVEGAHRIAIMDMRLLNRDRNDENLLVKKGAGRECELIPIDHGCSLPDSFEVNWHDWAWLSWPQTKQPLRAAEKAYIMRLNAEADVQLLNTALNIRWQCLLVLRVSTLFLQKGVAADLTLFDIASMMSRDENNNPSALEVVFAQAKTLAESHRRNGKPKRRSPTVSPVVSGLEVPGPKLRRSRSAVALDFDAFKLPGVAHGVSLPADDCGGYLSDSNEEMFDEAFIALLTSLMETAISRRKMKRQGIEMLKHILK